MPRRRSSIQPVKTPAQQYFVGEGEGGGEESMELESDDSDEILAGITAASPAKSIEMSDSEDEMSMDETVIGGGIVQWDEADTEEDSDMDISQSSGTDDEEKTMDFTVALGGVVPVNPPQNAKRNRHSIGYCHALEPGMEPLRPGDSDGADHSAEMEMEETVIYGGIYGGMHDDSIISSGESAGSEHTTTYTLDFTQAGGGIVGRESSASDASFVTAGEMDLTEVGGGIVGRESTIGRGNVSYTMGGGMDFTEVGGGIVHERTISGQTTASYTTSGGMDFTTAGGGINYQSTEVYGRTMTTNIFAPQPLPQQTPAAIPPTTPKSSSSTRARSAAPDMPGSTPAAPRNPFAPPPTGTSEKSTMKNIFALGTPGQATPAKKSTPRAPTPARPQAAQTPAKSPARPAATPAKSPAQSAGAPSFARPTASSVNKAGTPAKSPGRKATPKPQKRNVFAPSPEELNGPPTPRTTGMHTAASVAKKLEFTPSSTKGTPNSTPASRIPLAASVQTTPLTLSTPGKRKRDEEDENEAEEEAPSRKQQAIEAPEASTRSSASSSATEGGSSTSTNPTPTPSAPASAAPSLSTSTAGSASRRASAVPSPVPELRVESHESELQPELDEGEEDMELEESEDVEAGDELGGEVEGNDRGVTPEPEDEDRPLPTITPTRRRSFAPRPSLGTPMRMLAAETAAMTLHPFETSRDRADVADVKEDPTSASAFESGDNDAASGSVPLSKFLETAGVQFLDDLDPHRPRRSSVAPRRTFSTLPATEDTLSSFTIANVEVIFLNMYEWAIGTLSGELARQRIEVDSTTRVCDAENPAVVKDYFQCPPEERGLYESTLRNFKARALLEAKANWYKTRLELVERIFPDVTRIHSAMTAEVERHATNLEVADVLLPDLTNRHTALTKELEENKKQVAEIMEADPTELADLKAAVVEQGEEIGRFESELAQKSAQLAELEREVAELEKQEQEHQAALAVAKGMCDEYTSSDIRRLQSELSAMQALHGWRIVKTQPFEAVYANELLLKVDGEAELSLMNEAEGATECLLALTQQALKETKPKGLAATVRAAGQLWTAASRLRAELALLQLYYPAAFEMAQEELQCKARLMLPAVKARADLIFGIGPQTLRLWPEPEAFTIPVRAEVKYGRAQGERLEEMAKETLASAVPHVPGVLLQACVEAAALYK